MTRDPGRDYFAMWQASQTKLAEARKQIGKLSAALVGIDRDNLPRGARHAFASLSPVIEAGAAHFARILRERGEDGAVQGQLDNARRWAAVFNWITDEEAGE
jgi:hypothetical protein